MRTVVVEADWLKNQKLIVATISGDVASADVEAWEKRLGDALNQIEDNGSFKIFVNMHGFKAIDAEAHKRFRNVIPLTLANYGWKVGYVHLFEEESKAMKVKHERGIKCVGASHSHQDETKMSLYEARFSSARERFFTDPVQARLWIENINLDG